MKLQIWIALLGALTLIGCGSGGIPPGPGPVVNDLSPTFGSREGGTLITIKGENFTPETVITLAELPVTDLTFVDSETMTCVTPAADGGTRGGVLVQTATGTAYTLDAFYFIPAPLVDSVSPDTSTPDGGVLVQVSGSGFTAFSAGANTVLFGGVPATKIETLSDKTIRCVSPSGNGPVPVSVTNANGTGTKKTGYRYFPAPTLVSITPVMGTSLGATPVVIKGTGFTANSAGPNGISLNGRPMENLVVVDDTTITCETPATTPGLASLSLTNANGSGSLADAFTFYPLPTLTGVKPGTVGAQGGETVTVTGTGFQANDAGTNVVTFGGTAATKVSVSDDGTLTCTTPPMGVGSLDVKLTNANGSATLKDAIVSKLFALLGTAGDKLYTVDTKTAATKLIGSIGFTPLGIAFHPNGTLYAITTTDKLITINISTGAGTEVAGMSASPSPDIKDITFWGVRLIGGDYTGSTYEIGITSGSVAKKSSFSAWYGQWRHGMGSDPAKGIVYYACTQEAEIYQVNLDSGSQTSLKISGSHHAIAALGMFDGTLYALSSGSGTQGGTMTLYSYNSGITGTSSIGSLSVALHTLAGTP